MRGTFAMGSWLVLAALPLTGLAEPLAKGSAPRETWNVAALRAMGPDGLREVLAAWDSLSSEDPVRDELREVIDAVAGQRYAWASRLYWHTDWDAAVAEARRQKKPILSLRLLGRLTDELSCANSRFFRTALYANEEISAELREKFVLHWSSERPAAVATIDFGDGRVLKRTVTGNSIHYVVDYDGLVLDALPGLLGPGSFRHWLTEAHGVWKQTRNVKSRETAVRAVHNGRRMRLMTEWMTLAGQLPKPAVAPATTPVNRGQAALTQAGRKNAAPEAERAVKLAVTKSAVEFVMIPHLTMSGKPLRQIDDQEMWDKAGDLLAGQARLDAASRKLIRWQRPVPGDDPEDVSRMLAKFEHNMAVDTARNRYVLQFELSKWLSSEPLRLGQLNRRVYDELFLTPASDPWIGLFAGDVYTGLQNAGIDSADSTQ